MNLEQIDTSTTAGKAEVMRLAAEGRPVVARSLDHLAKWERHIIPLWNWQVCDYAIIADPVGPEEVWLVVNGNNVLSGWNTENGCKSAVETPAQAAVEYIRADLAGEKG